MNAVFLNLPLEETNKMIHTLAYEKWMPCFLGEKQTWIEVINNVKTGMVYEGKYVTFFGENFYGWAMRLLKDEREWIENCGS